MPESERPRTTAVFRTRAPSSRGTASRPSPTSSASCFRCERSRCVRGAPRPMTDAELDQLLVERGAVIVRSRLARQNSRHAEDLVARGVWRRSRSDAQNEPTSASRARASAHRPAIWPSSSRSTLSWVVVSDASALAMAAAAAPNTCSCSATASGWWASRYTSSANRAGKVVALLDMRVRSRPRK